MHDCWWLMSASMDLPIASCVRKVRKNFSDGYFHCQVEVKATILLRVGL